MILLSIVIPAYNASKYIEKCILSIINNIKIEEDTFEILIIDDGSNDDTAIRIHSIIDRYPKSQIKYHYQINKGASSARNNGMDRANGLFIWFIDADDVIYYYAISEIIEVIKNYNNRIDAIRTGDTSRGFLFEDDSILENYLCSPNRELFCITEGYKLLSKENWSGGMHTSFIFRRDFFYQNNILYPTHMVFNEDYQILVNALLKAKSIYVNTSFNFYIVRENKKSVTKTWSYEKHEKLIFDQITHIEFLNLLIKSNELELFKIKVLHQYYDKYLIYALFARIRLRTPLFLTYNFIKKFHSIKGKRIKTNTLKEKLISNMLTFFLMWLCNKLLRFKS